MQRLGRLGQNFYEASAEIAENRADLIESATPCHDAQVVRPYRDSNPFR